MNVLAIISSATVRRRVPGLDICCSPTGTKVDLSVNFRCTHEVFVIQCETIVPEAAVNMVRHCLRYFQFRLQLRITSKVYPRL